MSDAAMDEVDLEEMGPVDWIVLGWPGKRPDGGEIAPMIVDLVDRGIIRVLDLAFMSKDADGTATAIDLEHLGPDSPFAVFDGASTGLIDPADLEEAAAAIEPGDSAAILVYENKWAAPLAIALRRSGGLLLADGRIEIQALIAALDALDGAAR
ncbi:MAG: DUF6325 family protein [Solirubrobacteraceae bacterium]